MNTMEIANNIAATLKLPNAEKYDICLRDYDNSVEVIGYIPDPNYNMDDFVGREMLFPKRWVTLAVVPETTEVPA